MMERMMVKLLDEIDKDMEHGKQEVEVKVSDVASFLSQVDVFVECLETNGYEVEVHYTPKTAWGCMNHTVLTVYQ